MLKKIFHHAKSEADCSKLCCTKIEHFGVKAGNNVIFAIKYIRIVAQNHSNV